MASPSSAFPAFVSHCIELLQPLGTVRSKRMFGGWGLYVDEVFIAIVAFERLYLKVNADTRAAFESEGCEPFVYDAKNGSAAGVRQSTRSCSPLALVRPMRPM